MDPLPISTSKITSKVDIIIVGAGLSGLTSALKLLEKEPSLNIKILESTGKLGGQIGHNRLGETGGKWITADQVHIYKILKELKIPLRRRIVMGPDLKRCWDIDCGLQSLFVKHEVERYIQELDLRAQHFRLHRSDGSMQKHINKRLFFNKSRKFMCNLVLLFTGSDAADILYNDFMQLCYSNGGLKMLIDLYLGCPDSLLEIPSKHLLKSFQEKIENINIQFKRKVYEIRHFRDSVEVIDSEKEVHAAEVLILAIPWSDVEDINITPPIPIELRKPPPPLDRGKNMMTSFLAKYLDGHWRVAGFSGNLILNEPFFIIGHEYRPATYTGIVIHEEGIEPLIRSITLHALAEHFGEEMLIPIEYAQHTYEMSPMTGIPLTTPWNRIVWSSSAAAASCYRGRLGGAVQSGLRAAMNALFILRPQTVVWQDVAEIQCSTSLISPRASRLNIWLSSWNLYNLSYFSLFIIGAGGILRFLYKNDFI